VFRRVLPKLGALAAAALSISVWAQAVTVVEYYNRTLDSYFITGRANEQAALDGIADFQRTGMTFQATAAAAGGAGSTRICRFYISVTSPYTSTHFYGREGVDCEQIRNANVAGFTWEDYDFATQQPTSGACPGGSTAVYRGFRAAANGKTSNHRYSTTLGDYNAAIAAGYVGEQAALCVSAATAVTAISNPPSGGGDCGSFFVSGKQITYQSTFQSTGLAGTSSYTTVRTYDPTPVTFNGQSASRIVDTPSNGTPSYTMIADGPTSWKELGSRSTSNGATQEVYFSPPIEFPKTIAVGQVINIARSVIFNPAAFFGTGNQTGTITFVGRESVTVPAGTYANACKFVSETATAYPGVNYSSRESTTSWVVSNIGTVKSDVSIVSSSFGTNITAHTTLVASSVQ